MKALDFIFAARPLLLVPIWSIYLVSLHFHHELSGESLGLPNMLSLVCLTLLGAGACYINQVYDADSDRINNKGHFVQRGILSEQALMAGFIILSVVALAVSINISTLFFFICVQLLALSYFYSAPPLRLKDRPVAGLVSNAYAIGFLGSIAVFPDMNVANAGSLGWDNPFYFAMAVGGVYLLTTIPDREGDAAVGKQTIAVLVGRRMTIALSACWLFVAAVAAWQSSFWPLVWIAVVSVAAVVIAWVTSSNRVVLFAAKFPILLLTLLAGWYYPIYLIFVVVLVIATRIYYARRLRIKYPSLA
jgi:4-hydroxybenzoate polyprenyltransferase